MKNEYINFNDEMVVSEYLSKIVDLLIVTATNVELETVIGSIIPLPSHDKIIRYYKDNLTYYIGILGKYPVALFKCSMMGSLKRDASLTAVLEATTLWNSKAVVMVGIAFGRNDKKQSIGDILISETLTQYETVKEEVNTITRGHSVPCNALLLNRFTQNHKWYCSEKDKEIDIIKCEIISGEKLINDPKIKKKLFDRFPNAKGGEMEGNGVYAACDRERNAWIIIKSICDWADGNKKDEWQKLASRNSINYTKEILSSDNVLRDLNIYSINDKEVLNYLYIEKDDYREVQGLKIVDIIYPKHSVTEIEKIKDKRNGIYYEYVEVHITSNIIIGYLFLPTLKSFSQIRTVNHFIDKYSNNYSSLIVCSPKVKSRRTGKDDFRLNNIREKFENVCNKNEIEKISYYWINDLIWESCLGSEVEKLHYDIEKEKYFIDQQIEVLTSGQGISKVFSMKYFQNLFKFEYINKPIISVFGGAGVGKTTLCDQLINLINSYEKKKSIYISSSDIPTNGVDIDVKSISDLYKLSTSEDVENKTQRLDPSNLDMNISCGNIIVVIDGLDEIESKLKERFSFKDFISNVISLNESYQNCTIIITNRDYYKKQYENNSQIEILSLYGFNQDLAYDYFRKRLSEELQQQAITYLNGLHFASNNLYPPVILSLICDIIESDNECFCTIANELNTSSQYLSTQHTLDKLIVKIIEREIKRQSLNMSIDDIIDVLTEIAVIHNGLIKKSELNLLLALYDPELISDGYSAFYVNPLLHTDYDIDHVRIRYDIVSLVLKSRYFTYCISKKKVDLNLLPRILLEFYDGHSELLNEIVQYSDIPIETTLESVKHFVSTLKKLYSEALSEKDHRSIEKYKKLISAIMYYFFARFRALNREERTDCLKAIFSRRVVNLFVFGHFYPLDFRGITIEDSGFYQYENFEKSIFPANETIFFYTTFKDINPSSNLNAESILFDNSCSVNNSLKYAVKKGEEDKNDVIETVKEDWTTVLSVLFKNRSFIKKSDNIFKTKKNILRSKLTIDEYIKYFLKEQIFLKEISTSSASKFIYSISPEFKDDIRYLLTNNNFTSKLGAIFIGLIKKHYNINI